MDWLLRLLGVSSRNRKLLKSASKLVAPKPVTPKSDTAKPTSRRQKASTEIVEIEELHCDNYEVVGESNYQDALERFAGPKTEQGVSFPCEVLLVSENDNPHDRMAVRVELDGLTVGYLAREDARDLRGLLAEEGLRGARVRSPAMIKGGWKKPDDEGMFGVELIY